MIFFLMKRNKEIKAFLERDFIVYKWETKLDHAIGGLLTFFKVEIF